MARLAVRDTEEYCFKSQFSDCILVIEEEDHEQEPGKGSKAKKGKRKRQNRFSVPAHSILLATSSTYFAAKLENWSDAATNDSSTDCNKPEVLMPVPAGQLSVGQLLIRIIYQKRPQVKGASQQQLLQLLLLADRYHVPKVIPAVAAAFRDIPTDQLAWETALAMLQLPDSCTAEEAFQEIAAVAGKRVASELGDLEMVWEDEQRQQKLLSLPAAALKQLLQRDETCVASENTVAYTVLRWFEAQEELTAEAAADLGLLQLVRMRHCTQLYISSIVAQHELFRACFTPGEAALAAMCCTQHGYHALRDSHSSLLTKYPAWGAKQRRDTFRIQLFKWNLRLSDLEEAVRHCLSTRDKSVLSSSMHILQGQELRLGVVCANISQSPSAASMAVALAWCGLEGPAMCLAAFEVECEATERPGVQYSTQKLFSRAAEQACCIPDKWFLQLGSISQWEAVEQSLRNKHLVHADGCLHLRVSIKELH